VGERYIAIPAQGQQPFYPNPFGRLGALPAAGGEPFLMWDALSFTRASEASFVDPRLGWEFMASGAGAWLGNNVPRLFSDGAILIEAAATNLFVQSNPFAMTDFNTPDPVAVAGPDGGAATGCQITDNNAFAYEAKFLSLLGLSPVTYAQSAYFKRDVGSTAFPGFDNNLAANRLIQVDTLNGAISTPTGAFTTSSITVAGANWFRAMGTFPVTANGACYHYASTGTTFGAISVAGLGTGIVAQAQFELGAYHTSPIRTSGATATRAAELGTMVLSAPEAARLVSPAGFYFYAWPTWASTDGASPTAAQLFSAGPGTLSVYRIGTTGGTFKLYSGSDKVSVTVAFARHDRLRVDVKCPSGGTWEMAITNETAGTPKVVGTPAAGPVIALTGLTFAPGNYSLGGFASGCVISPFYAGASTT